MPRDVTIYHKPRCSKSRATLKLLTNHSIDARIVTYLTDPLSTAELRHIVDMIGDPHLIVRRKETAYVEQQLSMDSSADDIVNAILQQPVLLERPIVVSSKGAAIGRPPENVLSII